MKLTTPISDIEVHVFSWHPDSLDARTYLLRDGENVLCVDPNRAAEIEELISDWAPEGITIVLTHEHFDHISGVNLLRDQYKCNVICTRECAAAVIDPRKNLSKYAHVLLSNGVAAATEQIERLIEPFSCFADTIFTGYKEMIWGRHRLKLYEMPGHSRGGLCMLLDDIVVFTGDNLIPGRSCVTNLPGGSKAAYKDITLPFLKTLPQEALVLPGHFEAAKIFEIIP